MSIRYLALLGAPNCGKTVLFNGLTGANARVANYPGVTVEKARKKAKTPELFDPEMFGEV